MIAGCFLWPGDPQPHPETTPTFDFAAVEKNWRRPGIMATSRAGNGGLS